MIQKIKNHIAKSLQDIAAGIKLMQEAYPKFYRKYGEDWAAGKKLHLLESEKHNLFIDVLAILEFEQNQSPTEKSNQSPAEEPQKNEEGDKAYFATLSQLAKLNKDYDIAKRKLNAIPENEIAPKELIDEVQALSKQILSLQKSIEKYEQLGVMETHEPNLEDQAKTAKSLKAKIANLKGQIAKAEKKGHNSSKLNEELNILNAELNSLLTE